MSHIQQSNGQSMSQSYVQNGKGSPQKHSSDVKPSKLSGGRDGGSVEPEA